jgi:hypothetical protein
MKEYNVEIRQVRDSCHLRIGSYEKLPDNLLELISSSNQIKIIKKSKILPDSWVQVSKHKKTQQIKAEIIINNTIKLKTYLEICVLRVKLFPFYERRTQHKVTFSEVKKGIIHSLTHYYKYGSIKIILEKLKKKDNHKDNIIELFQDFNNKNLYLKIQENKYNVKLILDKLVYENKKYSMFYTIKYTNNLKDYVAYESTYASHSKIIDIYSLINDLTTNNNDILREGF